MTRVRVRSGLDQEIDAPDALLLDWAPTSTTATIQVGGHTPGFFTGWSPGRRAADLMLFAGAIYCADKTVLRRHALDSWTRTIDMTLPVDDVEAWQGSGIGPVLEFLTGDRWTLSFEHADVQPFDLGPHVEPGTEAIDADVVCLFSGGLDSLCGAIDLLEGDPERRVCLVSHHEGGQAAAAQDRLLGELAAHYGSDRIRSRRLFLRPAPPNHQQDRPLPRSRENTTRSRSVLFLGVAMAVASSIGAAVPVYVPENGFIGINVPLTAARTGTASTRTTHPHFVAGFQACAAAVGVANPILNPYRLLTKGEVLARSRNVALLEHLAPKSVSCSHPETARYVSRAQGNCGYCFPCLIRRASLARVGWDTEEYAWDALDDAVLLDGRQRGADLRAVVAGALNPRPDRDALQSGPLPAGERAAFVAVWRRGLAELRDWLTAGARGELASRIQLMTRATT